MVSRETSANPRIPGKTQINLAKPQCIWFVCVFLGLVTFVLALVCSVFSRLSVSKFFAPNKTWHLYNRHDVFAGQSMCSSWCGWVFHCEVLHSHVVPYESEKGIMLGLMPGKTLYWHIGKKTMAGWPHGICRAHTAWVSTVILDWIRLQAIYCGLSKRNFRIAMCIERFFMELLLLFKQATSTIGLLCPGALHGGPINRFTMSRCTARWS